MVAQQGENVFLVQTDGEFGRVIDLEAQAAHTPFNIQAILKHGYWEEPTASDKVLHRAAVLAGKQGVRPIRGSRLTHAHP